MVEMWTIVQICLVALSVFVLLLMLGVFKG